MIPARPLFILIQDLHFDMKNLYRNLLFSLLAVLPAAGCRSGLQIKFKELDHIISRREEYSMKLMHKADSLRGELASARNDSTKWACAQKLFETFRFYQADSALNYLGIMELYLGNDSAKRLYLDLTKIELYTSMRRYDAAEKLLASMDTLSMSENDLADYYKADLYLDGTKAVDEFIPPEERQKIVEERHMKRYKYINCPGIDSFEKVRRTGMQLYESERADEAVKILRKLVDDTESIAGKAAAAYSLAYAYKYTGEREKREYWLAQSAIYSLQLPIRNYFSLHELSNMLFEDNRLVRASKYCQIALDDALASNYNIHILNSAGSQLSIIKAVENKTKRDRIILSGIIFILSLLFLTTIVLLMYSLKQRQRIRTINKQLEDANKIKEGYVFRYIMLSANYLKKIEEYRHELRIALKEGGVSALKEMLRSPAESAVDYKSFYRIFDETFLGLFPDFVEKVNELLKPEARFSLRNKKELPTGLRILAALKIGFTDSGNIAEFLNCARNSVYTHRSKIKKEAVCHPEEFESRIAKI